MTDEPALAAEFPTPTREEWLALVDAVLKGAPFERLVATTPDGVAVQPLYTADDVATMADEAGFPGFAPHTRGAGPLPRPDGAWDVRVTMSHPDPAVANDDALAALMGGATSLGLRFDAAARRGVGPGSADFGILGGVDGVCVHSADALDRALEGVYLDLAPVALQPGASFGAAAGWMAEVWDRRGVGGAEVAGSLGADPLGTLAAEGFLPQGLDAALAELGELMAATAAATPAIRTATIDLGPVAEAGATNPRQLAVLLATGAAYLRAAEAAGLDATTAAGQIGATVVVDADVFSGIATCRAARRLWDGMLEACGVPAGGRGLALHARSAGRMMTRRDPWVNLLRVTAATFAAGVGGADGVTALPFDVAAGVPDELGRRLARNTQLLLIEESGVGRVLDPAGGSWYVEWLTGELARRAWEEFREIEARGGMAAVLADGSLAAELAGTWADRSADVAHRRRAITGVSEFPHLAEEPLVRPEPDPEPVRAAAVGPATHVAPGEATSVAPLPRHRLAEDIEALRDDADAHLAATGNRPRVFLAPLGPLASHTARATWARNFFEAGGIEAVQPEGAVAPDELAGRFESAGTPLACLCGSDDDYAAGAGDAATALRAAGASRIYLAGRPGEHEAEWRAAGVDEFVGVGVDLVEVLGRAHDLLGVER